MSRERGEIVMMIRDSPSLVPLGNVHSRCCMCGRWFVSVCVMEVIHTTHCKKKCKIVAGFVASNILQPSYESSFPAEGEQELL